ncbi:uncharacterized protein LOC126848591 isoform X2 [Cataglyphis hispanica]|uniref:uncharacterized protein LOC126848591 isoform X2 n=1 Tax=Cataglyphis hispanica TaxID=1086592 RepID=UPI00217F2A2A|nr:uncharacterized protein LOC126848591 isoform X2 [Cataglyphis hispanica]
MCIKLSRMLKLFLITLFCATLVLANSPVQKFQDTGEMMNGFVNNMADHFKDHGSSLVRGLAQQEEGGVGAGAGAGVDFNFGGGFGAGLGGKWGRK